MLSILTVNIGAASRERAEVMLGWLASRTEDVFILTETSSGAGTTYLLERFRQAGFAVVHTPHAARRATVQALRCRDDPWPGGSRGARHHTGRCRARRVRALTGSQYRQDREETDLRHLAPHGA